MTARRALLSELTHTEAQPTSQPGASVGTARRASALHTRSFPPPGFLLLDVGRAPLAHGMAAGAASLPWTGGCRASTCGSPGQEVVLVDSVHDPQRLRGSLVARRRYKVLLAHRLLRLGPTRPRRARCRLSKLASERDVASRRGRYAAPAPNPLTRPFGSDPPSLSRRSKSRKTAVSGYGAPDSDAAHGLRDAAASRVSSNAGLVAQRHVLGLRRVL